jgi:hypothetical protein
VPLGFARYAAGKAIGFGRSKFTQFGPTQLQQIAIFSVQFLGLMFGNSKKFPLSFGLSRQWKPPFLMVKEVSSPH